MDEELKRYLDAMMQQINNGNERLLDRINSLEQSFQNTKGFLLGDAIIQGRNWFSLEQRVTELERKRKDG